MKIIIGKYPDSEFKLLADDGTDMTELLAVTKVTIVAESRQPTKAVLELIDVEVEAHVDDDNIEKI